MSAPTDREEFLVDGVAYPTRLTRKYRERKPVVLRDPRRILAYIPGMITDVRVTPGTAVDRGEEVLVIEAMKMRNAITATIAGTVKAVHVEPGQRVAKGALLVEIS